MTPTADLRAALRVNVDESIPAGGIDANTMYTDTEIDALLSASDTIEAASAKAWRIKAMRLPMARGGIIEIQKGSERTRYSDPKALQAMALANADLWAGLAGIEGSQIFASEQPDVLGTAAYTVPVTTFESLFGRRV